jgi:hypothetical protein
VLGLGEALLEERLADEDEGEGTAAIEVIGGEQAEIFQRVVGEKMTLVDQEDGALGQAAEVSDQGGGRGALEARRTEPAERGRAPGVGQELDLHAKPVIRGGDTRIQRRAAAADGEFAIVGIVDSKARVRSASRSMADSDTRNSHG